VPKHADERALLTTLLKQVSRSFYLTLRVLPGSIRTQIGLAYLLARTTDTITDTEVIPVERRLQELQRLRRRILGEDSDPVHFAELAEQQGEPAERALLEKCEMSLAMLDGLSGTDRPLVREVLKSITSGQELDLRRFADVSPAAETTMRMAGAAGLERQPKNVMALQSDLELDDYTQRVAGCVGEFWTKMCRVHIFPKARLDEFSLMANAKRFGNGLQLVNILRDLPEDLRRGRCYLPAQRLAACGLTPVDLLKSTNEPKLRPLYDRYLDRAESHLKAGWIYTNSLPGTMRVKLACAWPVLIGLRTIERLKRGKVLDPNQRIKITRAEVRKIMFQTVIRYPFPSSWQDLASSVRQLPPERE
jgi:farnesyl-diphosphate farnesyltransferase